MKNLIVYIAILCSYTPIYCQDVDTLWFSKEKTYSRSIAPYNNELLIGTSKTGLLAYNLKNGKTRTILANLHNEEIRDVLVVKDKAYALFSGDHGFVYEINLKTLKNELILLDSNTFLDDLATNGKQLMILGDPSNKQFYLRSFDFKSRKLEKLSLAIPTEEKEACYAASGTTSLFTDQHTYCFISGGGQHARLHQIKMTTKDTSYRVTILPMVSGDGAGPFTFCMFKDQLYIGGGTYTHHLDTLGTGCLQLDSASYSTLNCPGGYRSGSIFYGKQLITCGTNGIYTYQLKSKEWTQLQTGSFCALYVTKKILYATSNKGFILKIPLTYL